MSENLSAYRAGNVSSTFDEAIGMRIQQAPLCSRSRERRCTMQLPPYRNLFILPQILLAISACKSSLEPLSLNSVLSFLFSMATLTGLQIRTPVSGQQRAAHLPSKIAFKPCNAAAFSVHAPCRYDEHSKYSLSLSMTCYQHDAHILLLCQQVRQEHNSAHPELQVPKGDGPQEARLPSRLRKGKLLCLALLYI